MAKRVVREIKDLDTGETLVLFPLTLDELKFIQANRPYNIYECNRVLVRTYIRIEEFLKEYEQHG